MSIKSKLLTLLGLSWLALVPAAKAQFVCDVRVPAVHGPIANYFIAFSSSGNYCTAAELENADTLGYPYGTVTVRIIFQHSTDGGHTWQRQDPGHPLELVDDTHFINSVDQIDSLNAVAVGDSGLILRTSDGGETWQQQSLGVNIRTLFKVSFANPNEGMVIGYDASINSVVAFFTINGGSSWTLTPLKDTLSDGRAYGNGKFRLFENLRGRVYTTLDYFQSIDTTNAIFDSFAIINSHLRSLESCRFGDGDSMIAYGADFISGKPLTTNALIWRSTNAGKSWQELLDTGDGTAGVSTMTDIDRDTVIAGFGLGENKILFSTDHGATWRMDTLLFDTAVDAIDCRGLGLNPNGSLVGAFGGSTSFLIFGQPSSARVLGDVRPPVNLARMYPNPATSSVKIVSQLTQCPIQLLDILGREVLSAIVPASGTLTLDVSQLPRGIYMAMMEVDGQMLPVGKIVLAGE